MIPKDVLDKVRRIEITTSRLVNDFFAGAYHSAFKGRGMEFDQVREYQMGDDIRTIDWNVTARTGKTHVKQHVEERELSVMILVDASASNRFASTGILKNQLAAELAAVLAFAAIGNNDKVGLLIFTDQVELFIAPRKGKSHVLRVIREVLYFEPKGKTTNIPAALEYLIRVARRRCVGFLISDFYQTDLRKTLNLANKYHDLVAITLNDPRESSLPKCGVIQVKDAETGELNWLDTSNASVRSWYEHKAMERLVERDRLFGNTGVDHIDITTNEPYVAQLVAFFAGRRRRI
ncbi:MAG: DUF58 domain-containing protein [Candidatus Omnitrophica bacterium]|nr:DUF58 domain-containing protein [Candidatus Omnitrophota bacterium]